ncbi:ABC transporter ATP-binding protein [Nesterenkonia aerolata]|uniref:ABC transporter ATP-binding protein n=1 Tax=Nesterenkonia aerolata TaxID=3074079 RepID=A0ABU2DQ66_9MICC|nr:ABC transporter ATP-binding protein [Nesterenkonia sp. LY-0111]MDR8018599.1 ABC transporter ATP-binding protein [Nesterenkonia sp. LY-0111]
MAAVSFDRIEIRYDDGHTALEEISLDIDDGEFIALVGPSGSGKTTLLRTLAGFLTPSAGTISLAGEPIASSAGGTSVESRGLGMVFQQHALWPHMSVEANISYPLRLARLPRSERRRRVTDVLELVGLSGMEARRPDQLSGGQQQRVALARAIVHEPSVLLLDEALSALDEPLRASLRFQLQSMSRRLGLTVVHVTHDRSEALAVADRVVVLDGGRICQVATPQELVASPASPFVAEFISDAALVPGTFGPEGFYARDLPLSLPADRLTRSGRPSGGVSTGQLAVTPRQLQVSPLGDDGADEGAGAPEVVSSLFGSHAHSVELQWREMSLRGEAAGYRPSPGERVQVHITGGTFFEAAAGAGQDPAQEPAQEPAEVSTRQDPAEPV